MMVRRKEDGKLGIDILEWLNSLPDDRQDLATAAVAAGATLFIVGFYTILFFVLLPLVG